MRKLSAFLATILAIIMCSCGGPVGHVEYPGDPVYVDDAKTMAYYEITPSYCNSILDKDVFIVCVDPVPTMKLANTDAYIPYTEVEQSAGKFPTDKNAPILIYCSMGRDSYVVSTYLAKNGYTYVMELKGGVFGYVQQGYVAS